MKLNRFLNVLGLALLLVSFSDITWEMMIGQADKQLYEAKTSGRNQIKLGYTKNEKLKLIE
ncbi:hypothetical protein GCM10007978_47450 [Shewanella hanedai]|uniref:Uncharacterized protein n=1 Tax=Shewanella hanedai TaxID=25 RepID=A0A553JEL5_SHEHA|nr:hypothetical protein [Shewanella hanedai]TRY10894.1 hypothetical protein FN961_24650 [Shewanella hanedai]GGJ04368.1 hypothetical protein GCM10007978_47450 [Shewanella hanedai]